MIRKSLALFAALGMVATVGFNNSILAGTTLVRDAMKSENYVPGVSGWQVTRDGDAEFNNLQSRGTFVSGDGTGKRIEINGSGPYANGITLYTGNAQEAAPAQLQALDGVGDFPQLGVELTSPTAGAPTQSAFLRLLSQTNDPNGSAAWISAKEISVLGALEVDTDETWHNLTLVNSWATLAGLVPRYRKDFAGNIYLIGRLSGGTTGTIATLPVGYRPIAVIDIALKSAGDSSSVSWIQVNTTGTITVVGNVAAAQTWLALNLSFSARQN